MRCDISFVQMELFQCVSLVTQIEYVLYVLFISHQCYVLKKYSTPTTHLISDKLSIKKFNWL